MVKKKRDNEIICRLTGSQSFQVTGSNTVVSWNTEQGRKHLLVDMGICQGGSKWDEYINNKKMLDNIPIKYAEYCFITHTHSDHIQNICSLYPRGFKGKVLLTPINNVLANIMLKDGTKIHQDDCRYLREKGKKCKDLYTLQDMYATLDLVEEVPMNQLIKLDDYVSFRYVNNSHILGATQLELYIRKYKTNTVKKLVFVGDLGNEINYSFNYFVNKTKLITNANVVFMESTYGNSKRNFTKKECIQERNELKKEILNTLDNNGSVLIPSFSQHRLQNLMCWIYDTFKDIWDERIPIVIDTNLGCKINHALNKILSEKELTYWEEVCSWKCFKFIESYDSSIAFLSKKEKALILSSSGMISGGRSILHAHRLLGQENSAILFCGYCSPNCIGGQILDDELQSVYFESMNKSTILKKCKIRKFNTFSSHATQKDLINYIKQCNCEDVVLMHGEKEAKEELKEYLQNELSKINRTVKVHVSELNYEIKL